MEGRWTKRRERFRALLAGDLCVHPGSVFDPMSARIAEDLGFECGMFAGSVASLVVLGAPDNITITLTEFAEQAHRISRAGELPLMVDADHGYGNALNVMRTVEELEAAGVAGLSIEDTLLPEPFGGVGNPRVLSVEEGVGKMKAALAGRRDPHLVIAGRTSAVAITGLDDCLARVRAYTAAGVDAIFVVGIKSQAELDAVALATPLPLILGNLPAAMMDRETLARSNVRICLQGHQPITAAVAAVHATLAALRSGTPPSELPGLASGELMRRATRAADYDRFNRDFLGAG